MKNNLIEQVGGIEKARAIVKQYEDLETCFEAYRYFDIEKDDFLRKPKLGRVDVIDLRTAIVQYEQLGNSEEFKVGDWIVSDDGCFPILSIQYGNLYEVGKGNFWELGSFKHATPSEIAVGHRLEAERHG